MSEKLKIKYKWIRFEKKENSEEWNCINTSGQWLADLYYETGWRQFVAFIEKDARFNHQCLTDMASFLMQLNRTKGCFKGTKPEPNWKKIAERLAEALGDIYRGLEFNNVVTRHSRNNAREALKVFNEAKGKK